MYPRRLAAISMAVLALVLTSAHAQDTPPTQLPSVELPAELQRVLTDYEAAWAAKDAKALSMLFTEDGYVLSGGRPPVHGRAAIEERYQGRGGPLALRALAWAAEGRVAYIIGAYARNRGDTDMGKFTLTLRKQDDGRWLIVSDMDNGNTPPKKRGGE